MLLFFTRRLPIQVVLELRMHEVAKIMRIISKIWLVLSFFILTSHTSARKSYYANNEQQKLHKR
jgi:hypothetical protein